jgi:hypothetical protein
MSLIPLPSDLKKIGMKAKYELESDLLRLHVIYRFEVMEVDVTDKDIEEYKVLMVFIGSQLIVSDCQIKRLYRKYCFFRACRMNPRFSHIPTELIYGFFDVKEGSI